MAKSEFTDEQIAQGLAACRHPPWGQTFRQVAEGILVAGEPLDHGVIERFRQAIIRLWEQEEAKTDDQG